MKNILFVLIFSSFVWSGIGYVKNINGNAEIVRDMQTLKVKKGTELKVEDKIITEKGARLQAVLTDNTIVTIGSNSVFVFDSYNFGNKNNSKVSMHIDQGYLRSVTGKIGKMAPKRFHVKTLAAVIGIRGTDFSASVSNVKEIIACHRGEISVKSNNKTYIVGKGEEVILENKQSGITNNTVCSPYMGSGLIYNRVYSVDSSWFNKSVTTQDETGGAVFIAGCQFNKYAAVEGRVTKAAFSRNYSDLTTYSVFFKPQYPITGNLKIYGLFGFGTANVDGYRGDNSLGAHDDVVGKEIMSHSGFQWGLGVSYNIIENISLFIDYTSTAKDAKIESTLYQYDPAIYHKLSTDGITVGMIYSF